jgi:hypothetical protein
LLIDLIDDNRAAILQPDTVISLVDMLESDTIWVKSTATDVLIELANYGTSFFRSILPVLSVLIGDARESILRCNAIPLLLKIDNNEVDMRSTTVRAVLKLAQYCMLFVSFDMLLWLTASTDETRVSMLHHDVIALLGKMLQRNDIRVSVAAYILIEIAIYGAPVPSFKFALPNWLHR